MRRRPPRGETGSARAGALALVLVLVTVATATWVWNHGSVGALPLRPHCTATADGASSELAPDQIGNAAIITAISVKRGLPARAASIGIATAKQESKLRNIDYGDRDSLGLFQQRPSQGWGEPDQLLDPVYASNAFFDVLVKIEGYENLPITAAAQRVQRSAFPTAYAQHEPEARIFASALSGYSPATLTCLLEPVESAREAVGGDGLTPRAAAVAKAASRETGRRGVSASTDGDRLRFTLAGREGVRLSWSLAQWAVARAAGLDIVAVEVGGKQWRRDRPHEGWTTTTGGPAAGTVVVTVANG